MQRGVTAATRTGAHPGGAARCSSSVRGAARRRSTGASGMGTGAGAGAGAAHVCGGSGHRDTGSRATATGDGGASRTVHGHVLLALVAHKQGPELLEPAHDLHRDVAALGGRDIIQHGAQASHAFHHGGRLLRARKGRGGKGGGKGGGGGGRDSV